MNESKMRLKGMFHVDHIREGKVIGHYEFNNGVVDGGFDKLLDVMFHAVTPISTWYIGLIDNVDYTAIDHTDAMNSHPGWIESIIYDEVTRVAWTEGAAASQSITNATAVVFTMNDTGVLKGVFVTSGSAKSDTTGTLWATALFTATVSVVSADQLKITYTITASEI